MSIVKQGHLKGTFKGFKNRKTIFEFSNGGKWVQNEYKYHYHYSYRPLAQVVQDGGRYYLEVNGLPDRVQVKRA